MPGGAPIFAPPGTSSAHNIANVDPGLASHVEPAQIEGAKIHAPPGILPPDPADLLRPFAPTGEATGDAQQQSAQVPTGGRGRGRGRPKAACDSCARSKRRCGPSCPGYPGLQPIAQIATPAQLPALAAPAVPLQSACGATDLSSAEPRPPLADGSQAAATVAEPTQAQTPPLPPVVDRDATPTEAGDDAAALRASSSGASKPPNLHAKTPAWSLRQRYSMYEVE